MEDNTEMYGNAALPSVQTLKTVARVNPSQALAAFYSLKAPSKPLKFEYIRMYLYRRLKRTLRRYQKSAFLHIDGVPTSTNRGETHEKLTEIAALCETHKAEIGTFIDKTKGPKVDHKNSGVEVPFTTYSNRYIASVLAGAAVARVYSLFVELLFALLDCRQLASYWKIGCCDGKHSAKCVEKWEILKSAFLQEIEVYKNQSFVYTQVEGLVAI